MTNAHTCLVHFDEGDSTTGLSYICTRPRGHKGQHVAHDVDGVTVLKAWSAEEPDSLQGVMDSLVTAHRDLCRTTTRRDRLVREARSLGATWSQVGATLGISAQGAQKRYGSGEERREAYETRQAARKAARVAKNDDAPTQADPWPDGTTQGTI